MCSFWNGTHNCLTLAPRSAGAVPYTLLFYQPSRLPPLSTGMAQMPYVGTTSSRWCFLNALLLLHQPSHLLRLSTGMAWLPYAGSMSTSPLTSLVCQQVWHDCLMLAACPPALSPPLSVNRCGMTALCWQHVHQPSHLPCLSTGMAWLPYAGNMSSRCYLWCCTSTAWHPSALPPAPSPPSSVDWWSFWHLNIRSVHWTKSQMVG